MAKTGPKGPTKPMDDKQFEQMLGMVRIQCTQDEICGILGMTEPTLDARLKERGYKNFLDCYKRHGDEGRASLRRMQWKSAEEGNVTAQIWLGKQVLGQRDKHETDHISSNGTMTPKGLDLSGLPSHVLEVLVQAADEQSTDD